MKIFVASNIRDCPGAMSRLTTAVKMAGVDTPLVISAKGIKDPLHNGTLNEAIERSYKSAEHLSFLLGCGLSPNLLHASKIIKGQPVAIDETKPSYTHIAGGNCLYYAQLVRSTALLGVFQRSWGRDDVIVSGDSGGAMMWGPKMPEGVEAPMHFYYRTRGTLTGAELDQLDERVYSSSAGLGLIKLPVFSHYGLGAHKGLLGFFKNIAQGFMSVQHYKGFASAWAKANPEAAKDGVLFQNDRSVIRVDTKAGTAEALGWRPIHWTPTRRGYGRTNDVNHQELQRLINFSPPV